MGATFTGLTAPQLRPLYSISMLLSLPSIIHFGGSKIYYELAMTAKVQNQARVHEILARSNETH